MAGRFSLSSSDVEAPSVERGDFPPEGPNQPRTNGTTGRKAGHVLLPPMQGRTLGKYRLLEQIGSGGQGLVYRGIHQTLKIPVAVKVLRPAVVDRDRDIYHSLRSEAQLLAQLNHPHIVRAWDFEDDPVLPYLVMEYVEGSSLAHILRDRGRLPYDQAVRIVRQVALGLAAAWQLGIIHRDVKPGNILIDKRGQAKVADLGQAIVTGGKPLGPEACGGGTPEYMSPEQIDGGPLDFRSDIYSLGGTLYHCLTGRFPFPGTSTWDILLKHAQDPLIPPRNLAPDVPAPVSDIVLRMMEKDPDHRHQSYLELIGELGCWKSSPGPAAGRYAPATPEPGGSFDVASLLARAIGLARRGERRDASRLLRELTLRAPRSEKAWGWLASVTDSPAEAVDALEHMLALNPGSPGGRGALSAARLRLGMTEVKAGNKAAARPHLLKLIEAEPRNEAAWLWLAGACTVAEDAMTALNRVLEINPDNSAARQGLKQCQEWIGKSGGPRSATGPEAKLTSGGGARPRPICSASSVLLADHDRDCLTMLSTALRAEGLRVTETADGVRASEYLNRHTPDVVIVATNLPGVDGFQLCKVVKCGTRSANVPVILIADESDVFKGSRGRHAGADGYLARPVEAGQLLEAILRCSPPPGG